MLTKREEIMGRKIARPVLLLLCPLLAGCAGGQTVGSTQGTEDVVKGTIVTAYIQQADSPASVWKGGEASRLYEDTGLILEFYDAKGQTAEELKLRLASGTIPDIIGFSGREQAQLYIDAGLLLPLNEYQELLPSLFEEEDYETALEWSVYVSGGEDLLLAPLSVGKAGEEEYRSMPMLLKSAWERAGSPCVSALEDYLDVIGQMKKAKPTSNVGESMYGICLWQGDGKISEHAASLAWMYGIDMQTVSPLMEISMDTNAIGSILEEDGFYKRAVHFYYEANKRGLLDPDSPNQTVGNVERKMNAGRVLFAVDAGNGGFLRSTEGTEEYLPLPAQDMQLYLEPDHIVGTGACLAVNKYSERAEDAVKLLNWLYDEENMAYLYKEAEGESGSFGVLGRTPVSLAEEGYDLGSEYRTAGTEGQQNAENDRKSWETVRASTAVYMVKTLSPELSRISDEIEGLVYKAFWNMVYAQDEEEFEAVWRTLKEEAEKLGMARLTSFYKQAWSEALERAETMENGGME